MREVAVLDRVVDGERAVLLLGDPPGREVVVAAAALPAGAREGARLRVELDGDRIVDAELDEGETRRARDRIRAKMDALRRRASKRRGEAPAKRRPR